MTPALGTDSYRAMRDLGSSVGYALRDRLERALRDIIVQSAITPRRSLARKKHRRYSRNVASSMSLEDLGKTLTQARTARGLTLVDAERDTRISSKYLQALEAGKPETLPAPVYARAFMRTYAQYLGLSAREFVTQLPGANPEPELPPLPDVTRETHFPLIPASWCVAGLIVVLLFSAGLVLFWHRGGGGEPATTTNPPAVQSPSGAGAEQPAQNPAPVQIGPGGVVPDLRGQVGLVAVQALTQAGLKFLVIEVKNSALPSATVFQQSPSPGTAVAAGGLVTLVVSR